MSSYNKSPILTNLQDKWTKVNDLWNGTEAMREAGRLYLPQEPHETDANYAIRLHRTTLFNKYKKTVETSVGKVFSKPLQVVDMPIIMEDDLENIDAEGSTFNVFAKRICRDAIHFGIGYIIVDFPSDATSISNPSPYWVRVDPLAVLDATVEFINGKEVLTRFAFTEEAVSYGDILTNNTTVNMQTRILYLDENMSPQYILLNEKNEVISQGSILNGNGAPLSKLPVIPVYGEKISPYVGTPVLMDLAELNIAHWQDYSDVRNINHITSVPMLLLKGSQEGYDENGNARKITISPNSVIQVSEQGDAHWIEHSGAAIGTNLTMLQHLEACMSVMGLELTVDTGGNETATGRTIDAAEANSKLKSITLDLESSLEAALDLHAEYLGILDSDVQVLLNTNFTTNINTSDMALIISLFKEGIISAEAVLDEAKKRTIVSGDTQPSVPPSQQ